LKESEKEFVTKFENPFKSGDFFSLQETFYLSNISRHHLKAHTTCILLPKDCVLQ